MQHKGRKFSCDLAFFIDKLLFYEIDSAYISFLAQFDQHFFIKIGDMAVLNLNNIFPVSEGVYSLKGPNLERNLQYRTLLNNEIRIIKQKTEQIINNTKTVYNHKMTNNGKSKINQRCLDFKLLEEKCKEWSEKNLVKKNKAYNKLYITDTLTQK